MKAQEVFPFHLIEVIILARSTIVVWEEAFNFFSSTQILECFALQF